MTEKNINEEKYKFLIIDTDDAFLQLSEMLLLGEGYVVFAVDNTEDALRIFESEIIDVVFCNYHLAPSMKNQKGFTGLELMKMMKLILREIPFIMVTGFGTIELAVDSIKSGAFDFLTKPVENERLLMVAQKALENIKITRELAALRSEVASRYEFDEIIGRSPKMKRLFDVMHQLAKSDVTVLIQGESGTGKELVARALHYNSARSKNPFVAINCSAIPETLLEAELFGYSKGAFTGAIRSKKGYFLETQGGTILLDEIGDVSFQLQTKLLRVLQEREIRPVGGDEADVRKIDVRIIAATNKSLKQLTDARTFRDDLYYRLAVVTIDIPPLRERKSDVPLIAVNFIKSYCQANKIPVKNISQQAINALMAYNWPGNVRQLENVLEHSLVLGKGDEIQFEDLPDEIVQKFAPTMSKPKRIRGTLKDVVHHHIEIIEKDSIISVLEETGNNKNLTAKRLGISRASLYNKMKQYNIKTSE